MDDYYDIEKERIEHLKNVAYGRDEYGESRKWLDNYDETKSLQSMDFG